MPMPLNDRTETAPATVAQRALWTLNQIDPGSAAYNVAEAFRLSGPLDADCLRRALAHVVARHGALRTAFRETQGELLQVIEPSVALALPSYGLPAENRPDPEAWLAERLTAWVREPFDLGQAPLARAVLFALSAREHVFALAIHHIVTDGWSQAILRSELGQAYSGLRLGKAPGWKPVADQFADHARREREWTSSAEFCVQLDQVVGTLAGLEPLQMPIDRPRAASWSDEGQREDFELDADLTLRIKQVARSNSVTPFMLLLATFQILLLKYTGRTDFATGSASAGRAEGCEGTFGYFANMLPIRARLAGNPRFDELLKTVRKSSLEALSRQAVPFASIVGTMSPALGRVRGMNPIFQVAFVLQNTPPARMRLPDIEVAAIDIDRGGSGFDLSMSIWETGSQMRGHVQDRPALYERSTIQRLITHYRSALRQALASPQSRVGDLSILDSEERAKILTQWSELETSEPDRHLIHELFEAQAQRTPDAIAIESASLTLSYRELDSRVDQLANHLRSLGAQPERCVAICCEDRALAALGALAVAKAGACFVPIDASLPVARVSYTVADSDCRIVLAGRSEVDRFDPATVQIIALDDAEARYLSAPRDRIDPNRIGLRPESLCYVIYTSGSTGQPKGVMCHHAGLSSRIADRIRTAGLRSGSRLLRVASSSFDVSVMETFAALCSGATLCAAVPDCMRPGRPLADTLQRLRISHASIPPASLAVLPTEVALPDLQVLICGGESCPAALANVWSHRCRVLHAYGPTEVTVCATLYECDPQRPWLSQGLLPIGRPIPNTTVYLLDDDLNPVPRGVTGEIYLGGIGVARGYLNQPALTAERFIPDPFYAERIALRSAEQRGLASTSPPRIYRTGDLGRWLENGEVQWLGRRDAQVKLRGFRIELAEIESAIREVAGVFDAAVLVDGETDADKRLVAFVRLEGDRDEAAEAERIGSISAHLAAQLPRYMVPAPILALAAFPTLASGKIDRASLLRRAAQMDLEAAGDAVGTSATGSFEHAIAQIWRNVLRIRVRGPDDDFFRVGGHSLTATGVASRIASRFAIEFSIADVFEAPTLREMATVVSARLRSRGTTGNGSARPDDPDRRAGGSTVISVDVPLD